MKKKNKMGGICLPNFKTGYIGMIKTIQYCQRGRHIDQWNRIDNSEVVQYVYAKLLFVKDAKAIQ